MRVIITETAQENLEASLEFLESKITAEKLSEIGLRVIKKAESLAENPFKGREENYLRHLKQNHRRIIEGHYKIIYRVENENIFVTDIFDTRQDPNKMKGK